jgi:hypothetical protein
VLVQLPAGGHSGYQLRHAVAVLPRTKLGATLLLGAGDDLPEIVLLGAVHDLLHADALLQLRAGPLS